MRILVTGASGLLGKTLCPMLEQEGFQYWACNSKIFDVTNTKMVKEIMNKISLDFIVHLDSSCSGFFMAFNTSD